METVIASHTAEPWLNVHDLAQALIDVFKEHGRIPVYVPVEAKYENQDENGQELPIVSWEMYAVAEAKVYEDKDGNPLLALSTYRNRGLPLADRKIDSRQTCPHCGEEVELITHVGGGEIQAVDILPPIEPEEQV